VSREDGNQHGMLSRDYRRKGASYSTPRAQFSCTRNTQLFLSANCVPRLLIPAGARVHSSPGAPNCRGDAVELSPLPADPEDIGALRLLRNYCTRVRSSGALPGPLRMAWRSPEAAAAVTGGASFASGPSPAKLWSQVLSARSIARTSMWRDCTGVPAPEPCLATEAQVEDGTYSLLLLNNMHFHPTWPLCPRPRNCV
jgi:hypothetical protein